SPLERKLATKDDSTMGDATRRLLAELNSAAFVDFLERLTGIEGLVPDPHLVGGGLHQIEPGGHLKVHADFNRHPHTGLERRLNPCMALFRTTRKPATAPRPVPRPEEWDPTQTSALYAWCVANGVKSRPQYLWPLLHAAHVARALDVPAIAALEFGVAGGNG